MKENELIQLIQSGDIVNFVETDVCNIEGNLCIASKIALPLASIACSLNQQSHDVLDQSNNLLGVLCFTQKQSEVTLISLSEWELVAYLTEIDVQQYNLPYRFRKDYFVVEASRYKEYKEDYMQGSPLWGTFLHEPTTLVLVGKQRVISHISAYPGLKLPTDHHREALSRAITSGHNYDRFLKFYHQLELLFDLIVVRKIQKLGDDISGFPQIISRYESGDLPRLKRLLNDYCLFPEALGKIMEKGVHYESEATTIFDIFIKDGHPIGKNNDPTKYWQMLKAGVSEAEAKKIGKSNTQQYHQFLCDLCAYWIFRIRCCIAHNKIGEYLLTDLNEEFVLEVVEVLLIEAICQILSNSDFQNTVI